jgi:chemotaxis protein MotB
MSPVRKKVESDESPGAPEWMVTFSDCMTLLLTFFVLLLSFSSFDIKIFRKMERALAEGLPSVGIPIAKDREAFRAVESIMHKEELDEGSEKPTLDGKIEANPIEVLDLPDLHNLKVFITQSDNIFWGRGAAISLEGRQILSDIAVLLKTVPNRIVINENGPTEDTDQINSGRDIGLERAWAAVEYLVAKQGLDKTRFSISAVSTVPARASQSSKRTFEIVILERSVYR